MVAAATAKILWAFTAYAVAVARSRGIDGDGEFDEEPNEFFVRSTSLRTKSARETAL
jgi:hypothetical protein